MMTRKLAMVAVVLILFVLLGSSTALAAVSQSKDCAVTATVPQAMSLTVSGPLAFRTVTVGSQATSDLVVNLKCNDGGWDLKVYENQDLTSATDSIHSTRLAYSSATGNGSGVGDTEFGLVGAQTTVVGNNPTATTGTGVAGATITVTYKLTATSDDDAGDYSAVHTYVAAKT